MIDVLEILLWLAVPLNYIYWIFIHHDPTSVQMVSDGSRAGVPD